jgi:hypothetical protein
MAVNNPSNFFTADSNSNFYSKTVTDANGKKTTVNYYK